MLDQPLDEQREAQFQQLIAELETYRSERFGSTSGAPTVDPTTKALTGIFEVIAR